MQDFYDDPYTVFGNQCTDDPSVSPNWVLEEFEKAARGLPSEVVSNAESLRIAVRAAILAYEKFGRMLNAALVYAAHGFPVFPLTRNKTPIPPRDPDPTGKFEDGIPGTGSFYKATTDPEQIRKWWTGHEYLIGLPMGRVSGLWCLDVDTSEDHADGVAGWNETIEEHEPFVTREHRSATGGPHLIFNWHAEQPIGCSPGDLPKGIEVRGQGGYIVVPPSQRKKRAYTVFNDINPIDAPAWLVDKILQGRGAQTSYSSGAAVADIDKVADAVSFIPNDDVSRDEWSNMALRIYAATGGDPRGLEIFASWSEKSAKCHGGYVERWRAMQGSPPNRTGAEKIFKIAREYGWVDKTTPTYSAEALSSAEAARDDLQRQVREFLLFVGVPENLRTVWTDFNCGSDEIIRAMLVPTGVGKTRITIEELAEWAREMGTIGILIYMVPTHRLGEDIVTLFAKHGLSAKVYRGRNAIDPDTLDPALKPKDPQQKRMCLNLEQVELAYEAGLDVATSCCRRKAKKGQQERRCKFYDVCGYQQQLRGETPDVWITAHEMLFHEQKALGDDVAAVIVDEGFWQDGVRIAKHGVPLSEMENVLAEQGDGHAELKTLRSRLVNALRRQSDLGGVERQHLMSLDIHTNVSTEDCTRAISLEYKMAERMDMHPGMSAQDLKRLTSKVPELRRARQMAAIWGAVRDLLERTDVEVSGHLVLDKKDGERIVLHRGVAPICKQWKKPTLILDATLPGDEILQVFYPQVRRVADIKVAMPHVYIRQVLQAPISAKRLIKTEKDGNRKAIRRYILQRWLETGRQKTLVVCQQKYEEWLLEAEHRLPDNIAVEHFNNIEGLDRYKDVRLLILVGRTVAKPEDVETVAGALTGVQAAKSGNKTMAWYERVERGILRADGTGIAVKCDQHPDPTAEAVRWQICEAQLIQAIGRGRGVNRTPETPLDVHIVSDVVLPLAVNEVSYWKPPNEVVEMLVEGIGLTSPGDMVKIWPKVWPNEREAGRTLESLYKTLSERSGADAKSLYSILSECSGENEGTLGQNVIGIYIGFCPSVRLLTYQLTGPKMKRRTAVFDPATLPDPRSWLESRLGPLAFFEIEEK
jgi:putative DNA primase/helicase